MIILVQDELLARTIEQRLDGARNVKIFQSIAELEEFINSLASKVTEDFIKSIRGKAHNLFIKKGNDNSIFLKMNVREQIQEEFGAKITQYLQSGTLRHNTTWRISPPNFNKKVSTKVFWSTIINVEFDVYKNVVKEKVSNPLVPDEPASPLRGLGIGLPPLADGVGGGIWRNWVCFSVRRFRE